MIEREKLEAFRSGLQRLYEETGLILAPCGGCGCCASQECGTVSTAKEWNGTEGVSIELGPRDTIRYT